MVRQEISTTNFQGYPARWLTWSQVAQMPPLLQKLKPTADDAAEHPKLPQARGHHGVPMTKGRN